MSIRTRLLLMVLSVLLPCTAAALWLILQTYSAERAARERNLADTTRAMALVVDRELNQRSAVARVLSQLRLLDAGPAMTATDLDSFEDMAVDALKGFAGWIELSSDQTVLLDTRKPRLQSTSTFFAPSKAALSNAPRVVPLAATGDDAPPHARVVQPVLRQGRTVLHLSLTVLPQELQSIVDGRQMPSGWVSTVIDDQGAIVARHPDGGRFVGRPASAELKARLAAGRESLFQSPSLDGAPVTGFFSTSSQGWVYLTTMPLGPSVRSVPDAVLRVVLAASGLLALVVIGTLWHARRITEPLKDLIADLARMRRGEPSRPCHTGILEYDALAGALSEAAEAARQSEAVLSRQVSEAVDRTREASQRASESQRVEALGRLTGGVAHDFNNLLGVVSNSAHLMQRVNTDPQLDAPLATTLRAVDAGTRMVEQLLRFAGRRPLQPQTLDLWTYLPEAQELMKTVLGKRIRIAVGVAPHTWPVRVDVSELELALINLSLNARDAMPSGGNLWLQARNADPVEQQGLAPGDHVLLTVTDDGEGLEASAVDRVFEPFFTTKAVGRGTGLGLSQVHGFCTQAGGTARFASTLGLGTTVTLLLPACHRAHQAAAPAVPTAMTSRRLAGTRVLLVEDNAELGQVTAALMATEGIVVLIARHALEALQMVESGTAIDMVLSDIVMPGGMDGIALAKALRQQLPALPVVLISGYSRAIANAGDFVVLRKPCPPELLLDTLQQALEHARA